LNLWAIKVTEVSLEISLKAAMRDGMSDESMGLAGQGCFSTCLP
jgi:hypothetical protein